MNNEIQKADLAVTFLNDVKQIIEQGRKQAYIAAGQITVQTYWNVGRRIVKEEQHGNARAEYGTNLLGVLANELTKEYGTAYSEKNLRNFRQFYLSFKDIEIWSARVPNLTWTHFRIIMRESSPEGRAWYVKEASEQMWSTRTLDRNVSTQYYGRMLAAQRESLALPAPDVEQNDPLEYIKNPVVAEFLGFRKDTKFDETQLEQALIGNLQQFILELGRGFAFVDRQKHIFAGGDDYYIDLVFYNIITRQVPDKLPTSTGQVPNKLRPSYVQIEHLVQIIGLEQLTVKEILIRIGLKDRENFLNNYLTPALQTGYVRMLYPDSPRHPRQKYLLTVKGLAFYNEKNCQRV